MYILSIRTDKPEAEIGLFEGEKQLDYLVWPAHRELAESIHIKLDQLLKNNNMTLNSLAGLIFYKGPGSFTGLRIGASVANALAYGLGIAIVGTSGEAWRAAGIARLIAGENEKLILPEYGAEPHITQPRH